MTVRILAFLVVLGLVAPVAAGQQDAGGDLKTLNLEQLMNVQFYTASKRAQKASDTPASVTVVTADDIRTFGYRTLAEVLDGVRGLWVNYDRNYSYLGVRGFSRPGNYNTRILLLVNGHRLNDDIVDGGMIGTDFPLDLDLIERIEIVRGPSSSLYGTNAFFGVINILTRQAPIATKVEVSSDVGSQYARRGRVTIGLPQLLKGALFSASLYQSDGAESLYFPEFDSPPTNHGIVSGRDGDRYGNAFAVVQLKEHFELQALVGSRRKQVPTAPYGGSFNDSIDQTIDSRGFVDLAYKRQFASGMQLMARWYYDAYAFHGTYAFDFPDVTVVGDFNMRDDLVGSEINLSRPLGQRNIVTAGTEFRYNLRQIQQARADIFPDLLLDDRRNSSVYAVFAQDEITLTSRLSLNTGVRIDHYSTFGTAVSPRFAAIYHPDGKTTLKYIFGRAFRAPSANELFFGNIVLLQANPLLKPETILSHNMGVERALTPELRVSAEAFLNNMEDLIDLSVNPANGSMRYENVHSNRGQGLEFEIQAQRHGWRGDLSYTLQKGEDQQTHERLPNAPLHLAKLKVQVPIGSTFLGGIELRYASPQYTDPGYRIPERFITNITVSNRKPLLGFDISASCYNLFDRSNYDPVGSYLRQQRILQDGRGFRIKIARAFSRD
ncbi:MAG: TonB-dependent receptor [Acidobacteriia bacterium]|nr:TonB-dependent receptor [Terriglobia bacterium]